VRLVPHRWQIEQLAYGSEIAPSTRRPRAAWIFAAWKREPPARVDGRVDPPLRDSGSTRAIERSSGKWKLVAPHQGDWERYDLKSDRTERSNLAAKQPEKVTELAAMNEQWA